MRGQSLRGERDGALVAFDRFVMAAKVGQQRAAVDPVGDRFRVERQRAVETLQRLVVQAGGGEDGGAVAVRLGELAVERDRGVETLDRLQVLALAFLRLADQVVHARLRRALLERAAGERDALCVLALLASDGGDVIERLGVLRIGAQHVGIALHGLRELALLVVEQALLQQRGDARRCGHGWVLSRDRGQSQALGVVPAKAGTRTLCPIERARRMGPGSRWRSPGTTALNSPCYSYGMRFLRDRA